MSLVARDHRVAQSDDGSLADYYSPLDWFRSADSADIGVNGANSALGHDTDNHVYTVLVSNGTASLVYNPSSRAVRNAAKRELFHKSYSIGSSHALLHGVQGFIDPGHTFYAVDLWSASTPHYAEYHPAWALSSRQLASTLEDEPDVAWLDSASVLDRAGQIKAAVKLITKTIEQLKGDSAFQQLARELTRVNVHEFSDMALMAILRGVFSMRTKIYSWDLLRSTIRDEIANRGVNDVQDLFVGLD